MAIQQSVNQLLGSVYQAAFIGKHLKQQKQAIDQQAEAERKAEEHREYMKPENVKARRIEELKGKIPPTITKGVEREQQLIETGWEQEEAQMATAKDLQDEMALYEELYDLTGDKTYMESWAQTANQRDFYKTELNEQQQAKIKAEEEIARKEKEALKKAEEEKKAADKKAEEEKKFDEKTTQYAADLINDVQREARQERRDWRLSAVQQLTQKDKFDTFLQNLDEQMWNAGGNN
jgi:hypothetical protein